MLRKSALASLALLAVFASTAQAQYNPFGVQQNVAVSTVTTGGWTQCYAATMSVFIGFNAENVLNSCTQSEIMMSGRSTGSSTLLVLAAGGRAAVTTNTGINFNGTNAVNGSEWYFSPNYSWGFAELLGAVNKNQCDTNGGALRMCLHTISNAGGYRIGNVVGLNNSLDYEKVFYERNAAVVPEPSTVVLMASGLLALGGLVRRRNRAA